jgi:hypothetical protein
MPLSTYAELQSSIGDWLNRADLVTTIPTFISMAEVAHNRQIRTRQMIKRSTATIGDAFTTLPSDMLEITNAQINGSRVTPLEFVAMDQADRIREVYPAGASKYFTIVGDTLELVPNPSSEVTVEIVYYARIPALSVSNTSNWLLLNSPDLYLYGSLIASAPYLRDDDRVVVWSTLYKQALADLQIADERARFTSTPLRARGPVF